MRTPIEHYIDIPSTKLSWVIVENHLVYHEADERACQFPGHGYPAHTLFTAEIILAFDNEQEFVQELGQLIRQCGDSNRYRGFLVQPYTVSMMTKVMIEDTNDDKGKNSAKNDDKPLTSN